MSQEILLIEADACEKRVDKGNLFVHYIVAFPFIILVHYLYICDLPDDFGTVFLQFPRVSDVPIGQSSCPSFVVVMSDSAGLEAVQSHFLAQMQRKGDADKPRAHLQPLLVVLSSTGHIILFLVPEPVVTRISDELRAQRHNFAPLAIREAIIILNQTQLLLTASTSMFRKALTLRILETNGGLGANMPLISFRGSFVEANHCRMLVNFIAMLSLQQGLGTPNNSTT